MSLRPGNTVQDELDELELDLRAAAGAIGAAIGAKLARIRPAMVRGASDEAYEPEAVLWDWSSSARAPRTPWPSPHS